MQAFLRRTVYYFLPLCLGLLGACGGGGGVDAAAAAAAAAASTVPIPFPTSAPGEGSAASPIAVALNSPRNSFVGSPFNGQSYYAFTTAGAGSYAIELGNPTSNIEGKLYSNANYTTTVTTCGDAFSVGTVLCAANLAANTRYYLLVKHFGLDSTSFTLTVRPIVSQGTVAAPVDLIVGTPRVGSVGLAGVSYYRFLTGSAAAYKVAIGSSAGGSYSTSTTIKVFSSAFTAATPVLLKTCGPVSNPACIVNGLAASTYYYVEVDGNTTGGVQYSISVTQGVSQGSVAAPVNLVVGATAHNGAVDAYNSSYYQFTTQADAGEYIVNTGGTTGATVNVYSDVGFTNVLRACSAGAQCNVFGLNPTTTYYVEVKSGAATAITYQIAVANGITEGSVASPVALTVGTGAHNATIDASGVAYYKFRTTAFSGSYTIGLVGTQKNLSWSLYSTATFSSSWYIYPISSCNTITTVGAGDEVCVTTNLDSDTDYFLKIDNLESTGPSNYGITVNAGGGSDGSINFPIALSGLTYNGGVANGSSAYSYYKFTTGASALTYAVGLSNMTTPLGWTLYTSSDFSSTSFFSCASPANTPSFTCSTQNAYVRVLSANTTYYLKVYNNSYNALQPSTYTLTLTPLDPAMGCSASAAPCFNFENGLVPLSFTQTQVNLNGNRWQWSVDSTNPSGSGTRSLKAGILTALAEQSCVSYTPTTKPASVSFSLKTETASRLYMTVSDGVTVTSNYDFWSWTGAVPWRRVTMPTESIAGTTLTFKWCFDKNSNSILGAETVWIDDIEFQ
jgi:hypothetical protein